jgi:hypothetical protein
LCRPFAASRPDAALILSDLLSLVRNLHLRFARYDDVDEAQRSAFVADMPLLPPPTDNESGALDKCLEYDRGKTWRRIPGTVREPVSGGRCAWAGAALGRSERRKRGCGRGAAGKGLRGERERGESAKTGHDGAPPRLQT